MLDSVAKSVYAGVVVWDDDDGLLAYIPSSPGRQSVIDPVSTSLDPTTDRTVV
jgi:hypothetical protein